MLFGAGLAVCGVGLAADEHDAPAEELKLTARTLELMRGEMRQHAQTVQALASALVVADWNTLVSGATLIRQADFLAVLTAEADRQVPVDFLRHYRDQRARAEALRVAATKQDPAGANFAYFRLLENCVECHAEFAPRRFPGLAGKGHGQHRD